MRCIDVFNGDADGICALHQLRLAEPVEAELITGVKRDIELLKRVSAGPGDEITVLDVSLERNRAALVKLLGCGAHVRYFDHHAATDIPDHPGLNAMIDESADICTSILVDRFLGGRFRIWAVVAAFGDNLGNSALRLAESLKLDIDKRDALRDLGENLNYNSYGETESDLLIAPADLYRIVKRYSDPFHFISKETLIRQLGRERTSDLQKALAIVPQRVSSTSDAYLLPDEHWSRRVSGTFANHLAVAEPTRAHVVLTRNAQDGYTVSVRSPPNAKISALDFCRQFPTGGGRQRAAGINHLEPLRFEEFLRKFEEVFANC
ncbi:MAG TPA: DHH family phosphoesterase [Burkholderiales bacterium]|nr:DHH family phosphoesterase [Burkholderiales bacterium]